MADKLCNIEEAAQHLSVSVPTLYKWARERRLPVVRFGTRALRFRQADLDRYVNLNIAAARPGA